MSRKNHNSANGVTAIGSIAPVASAESNTTIADLLPASIVEQAEQIAAAADNAPDVTGDLPLTPSTENAPATPSNPIMEPASADPVADASTWVPNPAHVDMYMEIHGVSAGVATEMLRKAHLDKQRLEVVERNRLQAQLDGVISRQAEQFHLDVFMLLASYPELSASDRAYTHHMGTHQMGLTGAGRRASTGRAPGVTTTESHGKARVTIDSVLPGVLADHLAQFVGKTFSSAFSAMNATGIVLKFRQADGTITKQKWGEVLARYVAFSASTVDQTGPAGERVMELPECYANMTCLDDLIESSK